MAQVADCDVKYKFRVTYFVNRVVSGGIMTCMSRLFNIEFSGTEDAQ